MVRVIGSVLGRVKVTEKVQYIVVALVEVYICFCFVYVTAFIVHC